MADCVDSAVSTQPTNAPWLAAVPLEAIWCQDGAWNFRLPVSSDMGTLEFGDG